MLAEVVFGYWLYPANVDPDHPQEFSEILAIIEREAQASPVFFKGMSYHSISRADEDFMCKFVNTFIFRDPAITLVSHYKLNPEFKREWKTWEIWHLDAAKSTGFQKDLETFDFTVFGVPRLKEMYEQCMPYYEKLHAVRIKPR